MAIYELTNDTIREIQQTRFAEVGINERSDLQRMGLEPKAVRMLDLKHRWASCSTDGTLNFHWKPSSHFASHLPGKYFRHRAGIS